MDSVSWTPLCSAWFRRQSFCINLGFQVSPPNVDAHVGALAVVCVVLCLGMVLLISLPWLAVLRRCKGALALTIWASLYVTAIVFTFTGGAVTPWEQVSNER